MWRHKTVGLYIIVQFICKSYEIMQGSFKNRFIEISFYRPEYFLYNVDIFSFKNYKGK